MVTRNRVLCPLKCETIGNSVCMRTCVYACACTYMLLHVWILLILKSNFYYMLQKFMDKNNDIESKHLSLDLYPDQMCICIILICVYVITCVPLFAPRGTSFHVPTCTGDMCCRSAIIVPCNVKLHFVCMPCAQWRLEDNFWSPFIPSFTGPGSGSQGIKLGAKYLTHWAVSLAYVMVHVMNRASLVVACVDCSSSSRDSGVNETSENVCRSKV